MNNNFINVLNSTETLNSSLPDIIEAFVEFYGEEKREFITKKLNNIILIGSHSPDDLDRVINSVRNEYLFNALNKFKYVLLENNMDIDKFLNLKEIKNYECVGFSISLGKIPFFNFVNYIDNKDESSNFFLKNDAVSFLKKIYSSVNDENIDELLEKGKFDNLKLIALEFKKIINEYEKETFFLESYNNLFNKTMELKNKMMNDYQNEFIADTSRKISLKYSGSDIEDCRLYFESFLKCFGGKINSVFTSIDCFNSKSEEIISTGLDDFPTRRIQNDRISYFKECGVDLGRNYNDYVNNDKCKSLIINNELADFICSNKREYVKKFKNDFYTATTDYNKNKERIKNVGLVGNNDGFGSFAYMHHQTYASPNVKIIDGKYTTYPVVNINTDNALVNKGIDTTVIHELNHVLELSFLKKDGDIINYRCGWDYLDKSIYDDNVLADLKRGPKKRRYELFSETINEMIAQKITSIFHGNNNYIFQTEKNNKVNSASAYQHMFMLANDFYDTFEKDIIESRQNGNIDHILNIVGKDNFEEFNNLFNTFNKNWHDTEFFSLVDDIKKNKDTKNTKIYYELLNKRDELLKKMIENKNNYTRGL